MARLTLEIECNGAAFGDDYEGLCAEAARILRLVALNVSTTAIEAGEKHALFDVNGNRVGFVRIDSEAPLFPITEPGDYLRRDGNRARITQIRDDGVCEGRSFPEASASKPLASKRWGSWWSYGRGYSNVGHIGDIVGRWPVETLSKLADTPDPEEGPSDPPNRTGEP